MIVNKKRTSARILERKPRQYDLIYTNAKGAKKFRTGTNKDEEFIC